MLLNPLYTAPLPAGFTSGTVEIKSPGTYVDQAGRVQQPSYRFSINADGSLTSLQVGGASSIVGMGVGDRFNAPNVDVVIQLNVAGAPVPLRSTYQVAPFDSGSGTLKLQQASLTAPTIITQGQQTDLQTLAVTATANTQAVTASISQVNDALSLSSFTVALIPVALDQVNQALASGLASVSAVAGTIAYAGGDHTTLPAGIGLYRIVGSSAAALVEAGQIWERTAGGVARRSELEAVSVLGSQGLITARIVTDTLDTLVLAPGGVNGDARHFKGRTYFWDANNTEASNGVSVLAAAGTTTGRWVITAREGGLNLLWFSALVTGLGTVSEDWIPALNAALAINSVYIPSGTFLVRPSSTNFIKFPSGVPRTLSGSGAESLLKVPDGNGAYGQLIGQGTTSPVKNIRLTNFRVDQNCDNVIGAVIGGDVTTAQQCVRFSTFNGIDIDRVIFDIATGINTVTLNGVNCLRAVVRNCTFNWGRNQAQADYDNSAVYITCTDHKVIGNTFTARSIADAARGAIETHGAQSVVTGNTITNFREGINVVTFGAGTGEAPLTNSLVVQGNNLLGGTIGVRLWAITGTVMRNVQVIDNIIVLSQINWPAIFDIGGVMVAYSTGGTLDGNIDGLRITGNDITFDATELRSSGIAYSSGAGIGLNGNGNYRNVGIHSNTVRNSLFWCYFLGRPGKTITHLRMYDNTSVNTGTAVNHAPSAARVPLSLQGLITDGIIGRLSVIEDTATAQAPSFMFNAIDAGSSLRIENTNISAPNNAAIVIPSPSAGITIFNGASPLFPNTWTAKQTFAVVGVRAVEAISDTDNGVYAQSTSGVGTFSKSTSGVGLHGLSTGNNAVLAQQIGATTASLASATMYVIRSTVASTFNVTGSTLIVDDAATVTSGTRFNNLFEMRWDGVAKFFASGASHPMGAGIITSGGWGRASAALTPGGIAAGAVFESTDIAIAGVALGDVISVSPGYAAEAGLIWSAYVRVFGQVRVRIANISAAAVTPAAGATWFVAALRS